MKPPTYVVYLPTRTSTDEKSRFSATFLGLLFSTHDKFEAMKFEFDYKRDAGFDGDLIIARNEIGVSPYALLISIPPDKEFDGWEENARYYFGNLPMILNQPFGDAGIAELSLPANPANYQARSNH